MHVSHCGMLFSFHARGDEAAEEPAEPFCCATANEDACYIFLDIDGVLNCAPSRAAAQRLHGEAQQTLALAGAHVSSEPQASR